MSKGYGEGIPHGRRSRQVTDVRANPTRCPKPAPGESLVAKAKKRRVPKFIVGTPVVRHTDVNDGGTVIKYKLFNPFSDRSPTPYLVRWAGFDEWVAESTIVQAFEGEGVYSEQWRRNNDGR